MLFGDERSVESQPARAAAACALELVRPGMLLGLGSGSTAHHFIEGLAKRVADGLQVMGVPTSRTSAEVARSLGIPITEVPSRPIDLAVDGADEIDAGMGLIKGGGGALTREKLVAVAAHAFVVIADESKLVDGLGHHPVPVEVVPFLWRQTRSRLQALGASCNLRRHGDSVFVTDNHNFILDLTFLQPLADPARLASQLDSTVGVVEHGLFLGLARGCILGGHGGVRMLGSLEHLDVSR